MTSETIAKALGGRKIGTGWLACCPAHDDVNPSLSITTGKDGKVLLHCHVGCKQSRVIDMLRSRGLWKSPDRRSGWRPLNKRHQSTDFAIAENNENRTKSALRIWEATVLADGTLAEIYTKSRGLRFQLPKTLRFHPHLKHPSGSRWPALVALISSGLDNIPIAIHRTFLTPDGLGKAPVVPQKMMLGPCRGGAVRLGSHGDLLMVGEGLETCLAAMQATGNPAWAALSTAGLRALDLPD
ncbi:MAG: virulence-associated protein E, partial [Hyphomicrobiales bacterium]|nr:virulence-associated protein E [Hyphomicrobiales bacterium]